MITIFTIPKPFLGCNRVIQRNAIQSWQQSVDNCEIILFGDDDGVKETAEEFGLKWMGNVEKTDFGTPLLNSVFEIAQEKSKYNTLSYVNADIIFFPGIVNAIKKVKFPHFLICGRRWDLDILHEIDFTNKKWDNLLHTMLISQGKKHGLSGMDYFIFPKKTITMPAFAVGRQGWDTWLIYSMRSKKIPVIDASDSVLIVHQNHDYSHSRFGTKKRVGGPELDYNIKIAGGFSNMLTLRDADWQLTKNELHRPPFFKRCYSLLSMNFIWRKFLSSKRMVYEKIRASKL